MAYSLSFVAKKSDSQTVIHGKNTFKKSLSKAAQENISLRYQTLRHNCWIYFEVVRLSSFSQKIGDILH